MSGADALAAQAQRTGWSIEQDKAALRAAQQTVRDYEQAFARIRVRLQRARRGSAG